MDSVSQLVLGSTVGYAVLGNKIGRKALLVGAAYGTLPDLDVLINFGGAVENFVYHRGFSHSILVHLVAAPILAWLMSKMKWAQSASLLRWACAIFLILATHAVLDSLTVYGTQLLWPLTTYPFGVSNLFIIDPLYTLPLLLAVIVISFIKTDRLLATKINGFFLIFSCLYATWSIGAKMYIDAKITKRLSADGIEVIDYVSTPSPFNTLLWRGVATTPGGHYEIYASIFDDVSDISMYFYESQRELLNLIPKDKRLTQLTTFTKGLYGVYEQDGEIRFSDLRMGIEGAYVFTFVVAELQNDGYQVGSFEQLSSRPQLSQTSLIFDRIFAPHIDLSLRARNSVSNQYPTD
ncbi:MAG: metal-dependent hydrolase [Pseudomonadota bacterium]